MVVYIKGLIGNPALQNHPCGTDIPDYVFGGSLGTACLAWDRAFGAVTDDQLASFNAPEVNSCRDFINNG